MPTTPPPSASEAPGTPRAQAAGVPAAPPWLAHLAAISWRVLAVAGLAVVLVVLAGTLITVIASVLIAAIISVAFLPLQVSFRRRGWSAVRAATAVWLIATASIVVALGLVAVAFVPEIVRLAGAISDGIAALREQLAGIDVPPEVASDLESLATAVQGWLAGGAASLAALAGTVATIAILSFFLTFFALKDGDRAVAWSLQFVTGWRREALVRSGAEAVDHLGGYLRGTGVLAALRAVLALVFLLILGVPLAGPLAALFFLAGLVPYVGGLVAGAAMLLVALAANGPLVAVVLLALLFAANLVLDFAVAPRVYGSAQRVHPAVALVAIAAGVTTAGVLGAFVAVPIAAFGIAVAGPVIAALDVEPDATTGESPFVPGWLDRLAQWSWRALIVLAFGAVIVWASGLFPLLVGAAVLAAVLAATFAPLMAMLLERGWHASRAAFAVTGGAFAIVVAILAATMLALVRQADEMVTAGSGGAGIIDRAAGGTLGFLDSIVTDLGAGLVAAAVSVVAGLLGFALLVVLAVVLTFYLLRDGGAGWGIATRRLADWRRREVDAAGSRAVSVLGGYMIGTGAISIFGAATQLVIMVVLGIPLALPLAVLSFFGGFIPYIGSLLTTLLAFLVTVQVGTQQDVVVMALFTVVFNIVQGNIVAPLVYGKAVNLHPAIVLAAIPAGGAIAGIVGMFLAVPVLGVVATTWRAALAVFGSAPAGGAPVAGQATGAAPGSPGEPPGEAVAPVSAGPGAPGGPGQEPAGAPTA